MTRPPVTKSESGLYSFKPMDTNNIPDVNQSLFPNGRLKVPYIMVVCGSASGCRLWHTEGFVVYTESPELIYPTPYSLPWNKTMGESCIKTSAFWQREIPQSVRTEVEFCHSRRSGREEEIPISPVCVCRFPSWWSVSLSALMRSPMSAAWHRGAHISSGGR